MKMYGYVSKNNRKSLYVRADHNAPLFWRNLIAKNMGITSTQAEEYIKKNYDVVEIEYNEVT